MKKILAVCALVLLVVGAGFAQQVSKGATVWVAIKTVDLKASTGFFAKKQGTLQYGAQVTVLNVKGNMAEVRSTANTSVSGWTAVNNLSARRIVATASNVTASEVAMAGKGFNQEVENAYKTKGALNYAGVDQTEAITVPVDELLVFVTEGRLNKGE